MRLPAEISDEIIDHLHDDSKTLQICSFVCKAWTVTCRFHLFSRLKLDPGRVSSLHDLLSAPWASFPRDITSIFLTPSPSPFDPSHLQAVFDHIISVQSVHFGGLVLSTVPSDVWTCIIGFLQRVHPKDFKLTHVVLRNTRQFVALLCAGSSPSLRTLSLALVYLEAEVLYGNAYALPEDFGQEVIKHMPFTQLEAISIHGNVGYELLRCLEQSAAPSSLTDAKFDSHWMYMEGAAASGGRFDYLPVIQRVLGNTSTTLTSLSLAIDGCWIGKGIICKFCQHNI